MVLRKIGKNPFLCPISCWKWHCNGLIISIDYDSHMYILTIWNCVFWQPCLETSIPKFHLCVKKVVRVKIGKIPIKRISSNENFLNHSAWHHAKKWTSLEHSLATRHVAITMVHWRSLKLYYLVLRLSKGFLCYAAKPCWSMLSSICQNSATLSIYSQFNLSFLAQNFANQTLRQLLTLLSEL